MATLADVFRELNALKTEGLVREYAIGGATAVLFYAEPARTYDVDVFVSLQPSEGSPLVSLSPIYDWARARGFSLDAEHILIHGVPVQFLPAPNELAQESVASARMLTYESVPVRVIGPEHLVALAFQAGGPQRRDRAWLLLRSGNVDREKLRNLLYSHRIDTNIDDEA